MGGIVDNPQSPQQPQQPGGNRGFSQQPRQFGQQPRQFNLQPRQFGQQPGQPQPQQPGQVQPQFMTPARDQNPQVAELIQQGNMQGAMDLQMQLAAQNGKFFEPRPPGFVGNPVYPGQVQIQPYPIAQPIGFEGPVGNWERLNSAMMNQPTGTPDVAMSLGSMQPRLPIIQPGPGVFPQPQPQDSKRGLGGLQLNKFRNRLS